MALPSEDYRKLRKNIRSYKSVLRGVPDVSNDTVLHHLKVQSYILLTHAAFEEYLEEIAKRLVNESVSNFLTTKKINSCVASLVAFETVAQFSEETSRKSIRKEVVENLNTFVAIAKRNYLRDVKDNHGIKIKDQKKILLSVGIDPEEVDTVTASAMDAFGEKRGGVAHTSRITTSETRSSAVHEVETILSGLRNYDRAVEDAIRVL
ncbi:HEPN domain-containing protein [Mangrovicoccus sp. HB161399]|uniref:HEPN domain-containing protein n=1 Tax=Mangrovicoccus sp. HB161399 TaxID=2720392 RepID=UPI001554231C|nr:HEPN domain-containing protein [Mangrovicoccus sp. HB161399]